MASDAEASEANPHAELALLCRALGAHLEVLGGTGAFGLPGAVAAKEAAPAAKPVLPAVPSASARRPSPGGAGAAVVPASSELGAGAVRANTSASPPAARLTVLASEVATCKRCALHAQRTQAVFARGTGSSGLMFVGEGPGEEEDLRGEPFVGAAGQLLDRMILAMKIERDAVYVCNIVKCRPPRNRKPEPEETEQCLPYLHEQIALLEPKVIVALGATAIQGLLGTNEGITRLRGQWKLFRGKVPVMPTFHPAYLLRQPSAKRDVWQDLQEVMGVLQRPPAD